MLCLPQNPCLKRQIYVSRKKLLNSSECTNFISLGLFLTPLVTYIELHGCILLGYEADVTRGRMCLNSRFNSVPNQSSTVCIIYQSLKCSQWASPDLTVYINYVRLHSCPLSPHTLKSKMESVYTVYIRIITTKQCLANRPTVAISHLSLGVKEHC